MKKIFEIKQKGVAQEIGQILVDDIGFMTYVVSPNADFDSASQILSELISKFKDSFGRVLPYRFHDGEISCRDDVDSFVPGLSSFEDIMTSYRALMDYYRINLYDIKEIT